MVLLNPIEGHGTWDGKKCFGNLPKQTDYAGKIAVLTRATIRLSRLTNFWQHVNPVAEKMATSEGFIKSVGIGEIPWIKQATFSIWESKEQMKNFAYKMKEHAVVVKKTHQEKWYSEEMFVRFEILEEREWVD
jgi:heme-degrading monooxygenase HmoA